MTPQKQAQDLLKKLKIDIKDPPVDVEHIASSLGARVIYTAMDDDHCGMIFKEGEEYIIGVNSLHSRNRQRFTIAHEIGHLCLHKDKIDGVHIDSAFAERLNRDARSSQGNDRIEVEANRFAAELLVPTVTLRTKLKGMQIDIDDDGLIDELADEFEVSFQSMSIKISRTFLD